MLPNVMDVILTCVLDFSGDIVLAFTCVDVRGLTAHWIMGDVIIRKYCCVFEYGKKQMRSAPASLWQKTVCNRVIFLHT